ncbi:hypothetical protein OO013_17580 [Mangrovivirga sp. M17]|uniref:Uncharacterized protein n=1 Tax=Mangrovivirga halotolerans TaxID=2993936 RepID=A0ABT3RVP6_9BACT|nr:hypothetical protein [Mangrovivirga halotolerans]MCX2745698.1 hypothetical protein [Mangrovivirga halotolerans]
MKYLVYILIFPFIILIERIIKEVIGIIGVEELSHAYQLSNQTGSNFWFLLIGDFFTILFVDGIAYLIAISVCWLYAKFLKKPSVFSIFIIIFIVVAYLIQFKTYIYEESIDWLKIAPFTLIYSVPIGYLLSRWYMVLNKNEAQRFKSNNN